MKKFVLLYNGPATRMSGMTDEQRQATKANWQSWIHKVGTALIDIGAPLANGHAVTDDGGAGHASDLRGYSVIEAEDMEAALKLVEGHDFLSAHTGEFKIEVFELMPSPLQKV